jgi:beta-galactosidase
MRLSYRAIVLVALCVVFSAVAFGAPAPGSSRQSRFNDGWRFFKGEAQGAEQPGFDDAAWRALDLPHDWAIEGPFDRKIDPHSGGLPFFGVGWYRKHFTVPAARQGSVLELQFDSAMSNSTVWINGEKVGGRPYGYSSFAVDLTPHIKFGGDNVVAVRPRRKMTLRAGIRARGFIAMSG